MSLVDKIKKIRGTLADDGSLELCDSWMREISISQENEILLKNPAFMELMSKMEADFKDAVCSMVDTRPELKAMKVMFARVYGNKESEKKIEKLVEELIK